MNNNQIRSIFNLTTESDPFVWSFWMGWVQARLNQNKSRMTPNEVWEVENEIYQGSNWGQYVINTYRTLEGSMNMDAEDYRVWNERNNRCKEEYCNFVMSEAEKGEAAGRAAYAETLALSRKGNTFNALRRIANSGSLKAAKAAKQLTERLQWNLL